MAKLEVGTDVITARTKAAVKKHKQKIIEEFCAGAKKKGHTIKPSAVSSVTLTTIKALTFKVASFKIGAFVIENPDVPVYLDGTSWDNNASTPGHTSFEVNKTTTDSYDWSMTAGIKTGLKTTAGLEYGLPGAKGTASVEASVEASVSQTSGVAFSKSRTWKKTVAQEAAPFTHFEQRIYGVQVKGHAPYTITSKATGTAVILIKFKFYGNRTHSADVALSRLLSDKELQVSHAGKITGLQGYDWDIQSTSRPLTKAEIAQIPKGLHTFSLSDTELKLAG